MGPYRWPCDLVSSGWSRTPDRLPPLAEHLLPDRWRPRYRLSYLSDPLVVDLPRGPDGVLVLPYVEAFGYEEVADRDEAFIADLEDRYVLELAPDDCHKAGLSGGGPYYIAIPAPAADGHLYGDQHYGSFVDYLREVFRWGGFPGIARSAVHPTEQLAYLVENLAPL